MSMLQVLAQETTQLSATKVGAEWQPWEDQLVKNRLGDSIDEITALAATLGRTYEATRNRRYRLEGPTRERGNGIRAVERQLPLCPKCFTELPALGGECGWCG